MRVDGWDEDEGEANVVEAEGEAGATEGPAGETDDGLEPGGRSVAPPEE